MQITAKQNVAIGAASAQSTALSANTRQVRLAASSACWLEFGSNPTAAASTGLYLPANTVDVIGIAPGIKIACIQAAAGGSLSIAELS